MSRRDLTAFHKTCRKTHVALAVAALCASLGACSTVPRDDGLGGPTADAGRTTGEAERSLWGHTLYLLGFGGAADERPASGRDADDPHLAAAVGEARLLDEVDLAMAKEDAVMPPPRTADVVSSPARADTAAAGDAGLGEASLDGERVLVENRVDGEPLPVSGSELTHEVGASETLWDIAKRTTGDATNWHVLADVNDLAPDAKVYPGQTIVVPADMVRPELVGFTTTAEADAFAGATADPDAVSDTVAAAGDASGDAAGARAEPTEAEALAADVLAEVDATAGGTELRLGAGETLWDFAKRTTGDATNWRAIAEANGFSEEQATKVYENMRITVPTALLDDAPEGAGDAAPGSLDVAEADAPDVPAADASAPLDVVDAADVAPEADDDARDVQVPIADAANVPDGAADALADIADATDTAEGTGNADSPVDIVEADYQTASDDLVSGTTTTDAAAATAAEAADGARNDATALAAASVAAGTAPEEIMVSGTYYPKAVYNNADFSSSLLMRVSPGTKLLVSRSVGSWYEVSTAQGKGYVHARDIK